MIVFRANALFLLANERPPFIAFHVLNRHVANIAGHDSLALLAGDYQEFQDRIAVEFGDPFHAANAGTFQEHPKRENGLSSAPSLSRAGFRAAPCTSSRTGHNGIGKVRCNAGRSWHTGFGNPDIIARIFFATISISQIVRGRRLWQSGSNQESSRNFLNLAYCYVLLF
jgi:hypothetical protein